MTDTRSQQTGDTASDIAKGNWVDRWLPRPLRPYARLARLDRPIGTWLLLLPCWWGLGIALGALEGAPTSDDYLYALLLAICMGVGAIVMRGAGCTWNDITDRHYDCLVARTASRPIPSGEVSVGQALSFILLLAAVGLGMLLPFPPVAVMTAVASLLLVAIYPFMKRITYFPQAWLGLTFNWGIWVAWAALKPEALQAGDVLIPAILYAAGISWTLGYDTIYAHQDKDDDALIGVKSTALKFGKASRGWIAFFYALTLTLIGTAAHLAGLGWPVWVGLGLTGLHFLWQVWRIDFDDAKDCLRFFKSNRDAGLIVTLALLAGAAIH